MPTMSQLNGLVITVLSDKRKEKSCSSILTQLMLRKINY